MLQGNRDGDRSPAPQALSVASDLQADRWISIGSWPTTGCGHRHETSSQADEGIDSVLHDDWSVLTDRRPCIRSSCCSTVPIFLRTAGISVSAVISLTKAQMVPERSGAPTVRVPLFAAGRWPRSCQTRRMVTVACREQSERCSLASTTTRTNLTGTAPTAMPNQTLFTLPFLCRIET